MALPWFRVDVGISSHDKILRLTADPSPKRYQAAWSYVCAIGWSVEHETDGHVPTGALPYVHGTTATARLLVAHLLWLPVSDGWEIRNFEIRQQTSKVTAQRREDASRAARIRWDREKGRRTS